MNIDELIEAAEERPRLPLIGEQVVQHRSAVVMTVVGYCHLDEQVKLRINRHRSFKVGLPFFWDRYTPES